jgi:hypothetical protein
LVVLRFGAVTFHRFGGVYRTDARSYDTVIPN